MHIKIYTNIHEDAQEKNLRFIELTIKSKLVQFVRLPKNIDEAEQGLYERSSRQFSYQYDDAFYTLFPNLKLNTKVKIFHSSIHGYEEPDGYEHWDESSIGGKEGYCHLDLLQRFILDFKFKKLWIQKADNFKWLIGSLIAFAGTAATLSVVFL